MTAYAGLKSRKQSVGQKLATSEFVMQPATGWPCSTMTMNGCQQSSKSRWTKRALPRTTVSSLRASLTNVQMQKSSCLVAALGQGSQSVSTYSVKHLHSAFATAFYKPRHGLHRARYS